MVNNTSGHTPRTTKKPSGDTGMGRGKSLQFRRPAPLHRVADFSPTASKPKTQPFPAVFAESAGRGSAAGGARDYAEVRP